MILKRHLIDLLLIATVSTTCLSGIGLLAKKVSFSVYLQTVFYSFVSLGIATTNNVYKDGKINYND